MIKYQVDFAYRLYMTQQFFLLKHFIIKTIYQNSHFP